MKGLSGKGKLEARIRELLFDRENSRAELNELLRQNKEAQAITARLLIEEAVLVSELRLENARDRLGTLEPREVFPLTQSPPAEPGRKISKRRIGILAGLAAAACLIAALWLTHKPTEEAPP